MRRILLLGIVLQLAIVTGQAVAQSSMGSSGSSSSGLGSSGLGGSGLGGGSMGGGSMGGGGMGGGSQFLGAPSGSGFGLGFMRLGQSNTGRGGSGSSTGSTSFLGPYFASPLALGYGPLNTGNAQAAGSNANPAFGTAFATSATGTSGSRSTAGGMGGAGSSNLTGSMDFNPVNSTGIRRNLPYAAEINFDGRSGRSESEQGNMAAMAEQRLVNEVATVVARSTRLPSAGNVVVSMDQGFLVLRGSVGTDKERRVLEAMVRMTPGVREIRNEVRIGQ